MEQSSDATGSVQTLPPKKKKEKTSSAQTALPKQPARPFPIGNAPSSSGTSFTILQRSPPKSETKEKQKDEKKGVKGKEEISSQETELDTTLPNKGKKKKVQAKLDTSPNESSSDDGSENTATNGSGLPLLSSSEGSEEHSPATTDFLAEFLDEAEEEDSISLYLRKMGGKCSCTTGKMPRVTLSSHRLIPLRRL